MTIGVSMKGRPYGLLLAAVAVLTAACGVRVSSQLRRQAANAQLGVGAAAGGAPTNGLATGAATSGSAGGGSPVAGATQTASGPTAATGVGGAATSGGGAGINSPSAPAPAGGNGGATDVGVTADTILLGNVSDLSGPVPGIFKGATTGTLAYENYINSQGGIFGRQLRLSVSDSQTECAQTENAYSSLLGKVFAFVGSFGLYDDCAANVLGHHTDIPVVQYMLSGQGIALPNDFSVDPIAPGGYATGPFLYYGAKFGDAVHHVGSLWSNIPSAIAQVTGINAAAQSVGWKFTYTRAVGATETNFTTDIVRMQSSGVKLVFLIGVTGQVAATVVDEAEQQNWHPTFVLPIAYAQNFLQLVGGPQNAEGIYGFNLYSLFFNSDEARNIPELALYQQWMQRTDAGQPEDLYSMYGWAEAALFVQALKAAGPHATRAAVMATLRSIHSFSDNGVVGPADPAGKVATHCYVLWSIHNGNFGRLDTPPTNFRCDGTFYKG
jgi:ABC-type branched-subunit amino acid transport system substrate-binding protein